jgi:prolyl 4-hydroxylase
MRPFLGDPWYMAIPTIKDSYDIGTQLCDDPLVTVIDDFLALDDRNSIMALAAGNLHQAKVTLDSGNDYSDKRTGSVTWLKHDNALVVRNLVTRVSDLVGISSRYAESLQVIHYATEQEYKPHFDGWDINTDKGQEKLKKDGQRLVTALIYLNEVDAGGDTIFPKLNLQVEAKPGRLVLFHDTIYGQIQRHPHSLHGGMPVHHGEKWACNLWFRSVPQRSIGGGKPVGSSRGNAAARNKAKNAKAARKKRRR